MRPIDALLEDSPVFSGLADDRRALVARCARNVGFARGQRLFCEGDPAETFYLVRRGRVAITAHVPARGDITIETIEAGEVVGWSWLFPPYRWHFDARAVDDVRAIAFDGACLRGKCEENHALGYELMRRFATVMIERLNSTRTRLLDMYGSHPRT